MLHSGWVRFPLRSLVLLIGVLLLSGCGNSSGQPPPATTGARSGDGGTGLAAQPPGPGDGNFTTVNSFNPCDSFGMLGAVASGFSAQTAGANIETARTPQSALAENVGDFAVDSLQEALEVNVSADCFLEFSSDGETGVWVALTLPGTVAPGAANRVSDTMAERGASVTGNMSSASQGATFDLVTFEDLPFDAPGNSDLAGALYFVASAEGAYMAVMLASYSDASDGPDPSDGMEYGQVGTGEGPTPGPTEAPVAVVPSGLAGTINDGLQPALEDAMGIDLVVNSVFETGSAGNNVVTLTYAFGETLPSLENGSAALTEAIEGLGGNVTFSISAAGGASAAFEKVEVGEFVLTGNLSLSENGIVAQLTIGG